MQQKLITHINWKKEQRNGNKGYEIMAGENVI
jgi:hypothetical protein